MPRMRFARLFNKLYLQLSILCPYGVVYELVSLSLQNQKQTNAIVSVLGQLGNLCRLSVQVDSKTSALLNVCLEDAINSIPDDSFEDQILKIKTFVVNAVPSKVYISLFAQSTCRHDLILVALILGRTGSDPAFSASRWRV